MAKTSNVWRMKFGQFIKFGEAESTNGPFYFLCYSLAQIEKEKEKKKHKKSIMKVYSNQKNIMT